ncbi:MAG: MBL fold metallo-hydrolase [Acidobacteria bacterium]|nr:MBL fold metallo-hydrolase [Acidobacteriota bacterium]
MMFAVLAVAVALQNPPAPAPAAQPPDFTKVEIKTTKLTPNFYVLEGQGGAIGVLVGPDGVFMVDSQFAPLSDKIAAAIRQVSDRPIKFMVNTHVHGDHTGGDENFAKMDTDGDTMVKFPNADVIMTGDFYRSAGFPNIDRANGGRLNGMLAGLQAVVDAAGPSTKIVPGHGAIVDKNAVAAHRQMMVAIRDKVAALVKQGKTQQEVIAAKPTIEYDAKVPQAGTTGERFVGQLYAEVSGAR